MWIKDSVDTGITYSPSMEEYLACTSAGLDYARWEGYGDPYNVSFKASVIAGWRLHNLLKAHTEAAQAKAAKRKQK